VSPLRVFQALVAAGAARLGNRERFRDYAAPAFAWLGSCSPPLIVAPPVDPAQPCRTAFTNNDRDAAGHGRARNADPDRHAALSKSCEAGGPGHSVGAESFTAIHYLWPITDANRSEFDRHRETLFASARSIVGLGSGIDPAAGCGRLLDEAGAIQLQGERWSPAADGTTRLRVPTASTFESLIAREGLERLSDGGFSTVVPPGMFDVVGYRRDGETAERPVLAFELRTPDFERIQPYETVRRIPDVAGMVRNAVAELARQTRPFGWTDADINTFVHGHSPDGADRARGAGADARFSYLPLPALERSAASGVQVGGICRVLLAAPPEHRAAVTWARVLSGAELSPLGSTRPAVLRLIDRPAASSGCDPDLGPYLGNGRRWSTVSPVVLHRHDPAPCEVRSLLETAFRHAGFSGEVAVGLELEWGQAGFLSGVDLARDYRTPENLTGPRYHVRVRFAHPIRGPLAVGAGRYRGWGLFAAEDA
jgi:CRISPR-associated protein Csb2